MIVFCVNIDYAERMRQALIIKNTDLIFDNTIDMYQIKKRLLEATSYT